MDSQPDPNYVDDADQENIWPTLNNTSNKDCSDSCAGSVFLEGSINGKYLPQIPQVNPDPLANGEHEIDSASVNTADPKLFRVHFKGYDKHTLEPRKNLRNAALCVNNGIDRFNAKQPKGKKYRARRAVVPDIAALCKLNPLQCQVCCRRVADNQAMDFHMQWHLTGRRVRK